MALAKVTIRTRVLPPLVLDEGLIQGGGAEAPPWWLSFIRPAWSVELGGIPVTAGAPYGEPEPDGWKVALVAVLAGVVTVVAYAVLGFRLRRKG